MPRLYGCILCTRLSSNARRNLAIGPTHDSPIQPDVRFIECTGKHYRYKNDSPKDYGSESSLFKSHISLGGIFNTGTRTEGPMRRERARGYRFGLEKENSAHGGKRR